MENWEKYLLPLLPRELADELRRVNMEGAEELRIRVGRPAQVLGTYPRILSWVPDGGACRDVLMRLCRQSVYAYHQELRACFMTLPGGFRVGLSGRIAGEEKEARLITPAGFNIRLARAIPGCADALIPLLLGLGAFAAPCSFLRRAPGRLRSCGMRPGSWPTGASRFALRMRGGKSPGVMTASPTLDVGLCTDVLEGCPKERAMELLLRGMSPDILVTDELAGPGDARAVLEAAGCGVRILASAHGCGMEDLRRRKALYELVQEGCFQRVISLSRERGKGVTVAHHFSSGGGSMRLFLALAALCASALYGYGKGYALTARQAGLVAFERDIPQLLHRMEYRVLPLGALVEEMGEKPGDLAAFWRTFGEKLEGLGVERAWEDALEAQKPLRPAAPGPGYSPGVGKCVGLHG